MVLKEFPQGKKIKQLKRVNASSYWRKIILVLAFLFLSFFSWKILVGLSEPSWEEEKANIQSVNEAGQVSGMTAYQYDFRDSPPQFQPPSKKNIAQTDMGLNIKGAKSAEVGGQGYNLGAAPDGDVQLPFNLFFPGRGQKDPQYPKYLLLGEEIDPRTNERVWKFNNSDIPIGDAANIPSIQRINAEMLDLIFGKGNVPDPQKFGKTWPDHRSAGYQGLVFGNDVPNPQIVVARFYYDSKGNAKINSDGYKVFYINQESSENPYYHGLSTFWRDIIDVPLGNAREILIGKGGREESPKDGGGLCPEPDDDSNTFYDLPFLYGEENCEYPGGLGWMHNVHCYKGSDGQPRFMLTIINFGVFEFKPTNITYNNGYKVDYTGWRYILPTFANKYLIEVETRCIWGRDPLCLPCPKCPNCVQPPKQHWLFKIFGPNQDSKLSQDPKLKLSYRHGNYHPEMSTTWYSQPLDTNNDGLIDRVLISIAPWKSFYRDEQQLGINPYPLFKQEDPEGTKISIIKNITEGEQNQRHWNHWKPWSSGPDIFGYPSDNNNPKNSSFAPTHIIEINYSSNPSEREYPNGILVSYSKYEPNPLPNQSSQPKQMNQIHPCFWGLDGKIYANNNNFMQVGTPPDTNAGGTCFGSAGKPPLYYIESLDNYIESLDSEDKYFQGPRIWSGNKNPNNNPSSPPVHQDIDTQDLWRYRRSGRGTYHYFRDPPDNDSSCSGAPKGYSETLFQLPKTNLFFVNYDNYYVNSYLHSGDLTYETRQGYPAVIDIDINSNYRQILWQWNKPAYVHMGAGTYAAYGTKRPESWSSDIVGQSLNAITDMRDGGLASQLAPPPHDSYVRDFEFMRTVGVDAKNNTNLFGQSQLAYALADENKNIFRSPKGPRYNSNNPNSNPLNYANVNIDLNNFAEDFVNNNPNPQPNTGLEKYQQIWLTALMWGDVGSGLNQFQRSNTPILKAWGINYKDKTAKFEPTLTATTGKDPDPRNYTSDGGSQFYTGKDHNQVRYKLTATNDNGNLTWPANNIQIKINPDNKESLNTNQVYYRVFKKSTPQGQKLKVRASKNCCCHNAPRYPQLCPNPNLEMKVYVNGVNIGSATVDSENFKDYEFDAYPTTEDEIKVEFPVDNGDLVIQSITVNNSDKTGTVTIPWNREGVKYFPCRNDWWYFNPYECKIICNNPDLGERCWGGCSCDGGASSGGVMAWGGYVLFPRFSSREWRKIDPRYINNNTITISEILEKDETIEVIYTTTIQRAGKINHKTTLFFNNRGNTVQAPAVEKSCTGNAPWVQTLYGDVYLGGGVHPYFAYGNATFLIQTGTDSLTNFTSNKPGWLQRRYPLADELKLSGEKGVVAKIKRNIEVSKTKGELRRWRGGDNIINSLNNTDKKGYYYEGDLTISGGNLYKNKGAKLIAIYGNLTITGDIKYYGGTDPADVNNLACLGIVVFGDLNISPSVGRLDGVYFVEGTINTCASATPSACEKQLVSYGLWVARGFLLNRTFVGEVNDPAEKIIYDGRIALNPPVGLSDFGRLFPVWKEVAP